MSSFAMLIGPLSMAAGILRLLIFLAGFLWLTGKTVAEVTILEK